MIGVIKRLMRESAGNKRLYDTLVGLKQDMALASQKVYDAWEQDEEGYDEIYGTGGICDDIADEMCRVVNQKTDYGCFHLYNEYDCHTSIYVYDSDLRQIYNVDIPPYVYEKGAGYNWKKIDDITFTIDNIEIKEVDWEVYMDEEGNINDDFT